MPVVTTTTTMKCALALQEKQEEKQNKTKNENNNLWMWETIKICQTEQKILLPVCKHGKQQMQLVNLQWMFASIVAAVAIGIFE